MKSEFHTKFHEIFFIFHEIFLDRLVYYNTRKIMGKIVKEMLSSQVYESFKDMIANHRFKPGSRLNIEQLTKEFGVSRTPVWEAVRRLEQEGLLKNIPNRGVFMVEMTLEQALELYQVREVLEGLAGKLAVKNLDDEKLKEMEDYLAAQKKALQQEDLIAYSKWDFQFHAIIYEASGNHFLQEMLKSIKDKMRPLIEQTRDKLVQSYNRHQEILNAFECRDSDRAEEALLKHNREMQNHIQKLMEERRLEGG